MKEPEPGDEVCGRVSVHHNGSSSRIEIAPERSLASIVGFPIVLILLAVAYCGLRVGAVEVVGSAGVGSTLTSIGVGAVVLAVGIAIVSGAVWSLWGIEQFHIERSGMTVDRALGLLRFRRTLATRSLRAVRVDEREYKVRGGKKVVRRVAYDDGQRTRRTWSVLSRDEAIFLATKLSSALLLIEAEGVGENGTPTHGR